MLISLFSLAAAGPLADVARIELDNTRELHRTIRTAALSTHYKLSDACTAAHQDAEASITKARASYDANAYGDAYDQVHATLVTLKPCALELAKGPKSYQSSIKAILRTADQQLTALDAHLTEKGSEESRKAYGDAVAAKTTARAKGLADQLVEATEDWYTMITAVQVAVKAST